MHVIIYVLPSYTSPWFIEILIKVTLVGAFSHVPTHVYLHASVHMASSQLDHVSLLSSLFGQPLRHLETSYSNHLFHWTGHTSLTAPNPLVCVRIWLSDIRMTDETLPIITSTSTNCHVQPHTFNKLKGRQVVSWCTVWHNLQPSCSCDDCLTTVT